MAWLIEVKNISRGNLNQREERELFKEFIEDYNTATFPDTKYYDLQKWDAEQRAQGKKGLSSSVGDKPDYTGMSDEDILRLERQRQREEESKSREQAAVLAMRDQIKQAKEAHSSAYYDILDKQAKELHKPTLESIAKQREEEKKRKEREAMRKYK